MSDDIAHLRKLRAKARKINSSLLSDLKPFLGSTGVLFRRLPDGPNEVGNVTTTCSCVMAMIAPELLLPFFKAARGDNADQARSRIQKIFEHAVTAPWTSSGLKDGNAFSALLTLRTAGLLFNSPEQPLAPKPLESTHTFTTDSKVGVATPFSLGQVCKLSEVLDTFAAKAPESFRVEDYPRKSATAYWFIDAIENFGLIAKRDSDFWKGITAWVAENFARQVSLSTSNHDALKDPIEMSMAACLSNRLQRLLASQDFESLHELRSSLPTSIEVEDAIVKSFSYQLESGIWPKYFPLFNYREGGAGSNYLFSFELLEAIVHEFGGSKLLENRVVLRGIERALSWCESNRLEYLYKGVIFKGWNSGGQTESLRLGKPESWATAMVHMFLWKLRSSLSDLIKDYVLTKYGASLSSDQAKKPSIGWGDLLDSPLEILGNQTSTKEVLREHILEPILKQGVFHRGLIEQRHRSALLFGPPGTAKTSIVRAIAEEIRWPLVELNPSHFLRGGLENIYSQADEIFNDLEDLSQSVVFFDEMDALAQRRGEQVDVTRQFLTTSMLPKLSRLHDASRVLFFMATNHLRSFDEAITRPGRFDLLVHVRPPLWSDKVKHLESMWPGRKRKDLQKTWPAEQRKKDQEFVKAKFAAWGSANGRKAIWVVRTRGRASRRNIGPIHTR